MILKKTNLVVGDNTMISKVTVIHLYGGSFRKKARIGDYVLIAIPDRRVQRPFINKNLYLGIIVTQKQKYTRKNGVYIRFCSNKVLLLTEQKKIVGTRIYGPVALEIKKTNLTRLLAVARKLC